jgi:hypothetical protein
VKQSKQHVAYTKRRKERPMSKKSENDGTVAVRHDYINRSQPMWPKDGNVDKAHDGNPKLEAPIEDYGGWYSGRNGRP